MRFHPILIAAAFVVACGWGQPTLAPDTMAAAKGRTVPNGPVDLATDPRGSVEYHCDTGSVVKADYDTMGTVVIRWNGRDHALRRSNAQASTYLNQGYSWSASGDEFLLTERGRAVASGCRAG